MKGTPEKPRDGLQQRAIDLLNKTKISFTSFDVMIDSDVREILKEISRCSSFPQIFIHKKFVGGLYFFEEIIKNNKISTYVPTTEIELPMREKIYKLMAKGVYMVFMRGKPSYPSCKGSMKMMQLFRKSYPWILYNPKKPELELDFFDLNKDDNFQLELLKYTKYSEIP